MTKAAFASSAAIRQCLEGSRRTAAASPRKETLGSPLQGRAASPVRVLVPRPLLEDADMLSLSANDDEDSLGGGGLVEERGYDGEGGGGRRGVKGVFERAGSHYDTAAAREDKAAMKAGEHRRAEAEREAREIFLAQKRRLEEQKRKKMASIFKGVMKKHPSAAVSASAAPSHRPLPGEADSVGKVASSPGGASAGVVLLHRGYYTYAALGRPRDAAPVLLEAIENLREGGGAELLATAMFFYAKALADSGAPGGGSSPEEASVKTAMAIDALKRLIEEHSGHAAARVLLAELLVRTFPASLEEPMGLVAEAVSIDSLCPEARMMSIRLGSLRRAP